MRNVKNDLIRTLESTRHELIKQRFFVNETMMRISAISKFSCASGRSYTNARKAMQKHVDLLSEQIVEIEQTTEWAYMKQAVNYETQS